MSVSFSLSAVIQLVAVNVVALVFFRRTRLDALQATGIVLAIAAVVADLARALSAEERVL